MAGTFTHLLTHVIFSTKARKLLIPESFEGELYPYLVSVVNGEGGTAISAGGMADHVHLLAEFPHAVALSEMMRRIKGNSSRWINRERKIPGVDFAWQAGYGAFSVSSSGKQAVIEYIRNQKVHHRKRSFKEEFLEFLVKHGIAYDERYIWEGLKKWMVRDEIGHEGALFG